MIKKKSLLSPAGTGNAIYTTTLAVRLNVKTVPRDAPRSCHVECDVAALYSLPSPLHELNPLFLSLSTAALVKGNAGGFLFLTVHRTIAVESSGMEF